MALVGRPEACKEATRGRNRGLRRWIHGCITTIHASRSGTDPSMVKRAKTESPRAANRGVKFLAQAPIPQKLFLDRLSGHNCEADDCRFGPRRRMDT